MSDAGFKAQMATSDGIVSERDLILGLTRGPAIGAPGMVALSKVAPAGTTFVQADLAGPWRVYLQRVESKLTGGTWQIGVSTFGASGAFTTASLEDATGAMSTLSTGSLVVAGDGAVTGTLANGTAATAHRYQITGTMRALKDLITGVLTARLGSTVVYQGLVTMVRESSQLDLGQASYTVMEGQPAHVTVRRTGNQAGMITVDYSASGGTAPAGDYAVLGSGTLTFPPGVSSKTFDVATTADGVVQGSRTVNLFLGNANGATIGTHTAPLTIQDNDVGGVVKFSTAALSVLEGTPANITVTRSGGMGGNVTVQWTTVDGTAIGNLSGDYFPDSRTLTFGPNEVSKQISISTISEGIAEGDESFRVMLHTPNGLTLGTPAMATVTLLDAQQGIQFGAPEYTVSEAMTSVAISVVRSGPATAPATVRYSTSPGNATPGADYTSVQGVMTFAANSRTATFMVPLLPDMRAEGAETVLLTLSDPSAPAQLLAQRTATLTIIDNDVPGVIKLGAATYTVAESAKSVLVAVQRTGNAEGVTVSYATVPGTATPGQDYLTTSGVLTFGAGETTKTIAITILNDSLDELAETFTVVLSSPGGGATLGTPSSAVVTITDEDIPGTIGIGTASVLVSEGAGVATITVTRTGGLAGGVTVDFATADGTAQAGSDYTARVGSLTFNAGETTKLVAVAILNDAIREGDETFTLTLSNPGGGALLGPARVATVTIKDDEIGPTVQLANTAYNVAEAAGSVTLVVTRTGSVAAGQSVRVRTVTGGPLPATPNVHFGAFDQPFSFAANQTSINVPVTIFADNDRVGDRTFIVELVEAVGLSVGVPRRAVVTIRDDDALINLTTSSVTVVEGATATLTVQRTGSTSITSTVRYTTSDDSAVAPGDYTAKSGILMFGPGVSSLPISIVTTSDLLVEGPKTFRVTLSQPTGAVLGAGIGAFVTIQDNDTPSTVQFNAAVYSVVEGGTATITVTRTGGSLGPATVNFITSPISGTATGGAAPGLGIDYITKSTALTFAAGATSQTVTVQTLPDTLLEGEETVFLALAVPPGSAQVTLGAQATATLKIVDDEQPRFQFAAPTATVSESAGAAALKVMRVGPTTGTYTVNYALAGVTATASADFNATGGTLTFGPGVTSQTITVPIVSDTINEPAETFTVALSGPSAGAGLGTPIVTTVTITDDDPAGAAQFAASSYSFVEGVNIMLTVTRTGTAGPVTVGYSAVAGTAGISDFMGVSGVLTFAAGEVSRTFNAGVVLGDTVTEGAEFFDVVLGPTTGGLTLGTNSRTRVWIVDEEQSLQFSAATYSVVEGGTATITVTRVGVPSGTASATVGLGGNAVAGTDYVTPASLVLTFPPGIVTQSLTIQTRTDTLAEGVRSLTFGLSGLSGAVAGTPSTASLSILDDERPDLEVADARGPTQAATGLPTTVTATVRNLAAGPAPASKLGVFLSPSSATPGAGTRIALVDVPALPGLASKIVTGAVTIPGNLSAGSYFLSVVADALGTIAEENEGNNGRTAASQVQVVLLLPDLVVTTVQPPSNTLSGKIVSAPVQVRNAGLAPSGPYRVSVYLSTDPTPGSGTLVAARDMPPLPAGAGADVPVSLTLADDIPQGAYFMAAVVDSTAAVVEASEANNALTSAVPFQVNRNLTKLRSVTAAFSTAAASPTCSGGLGGLTLNLAGTLNLATQTGTTGQGTITLSGPVPGGTVTFTGPFSATVNLDETVTVSFTATVTGAIVGTATATGSGVITGGVVTANITSGNGLLTRVTAPAGSCPFGGTLTAAGQPVLFFSLLHFAQGGGFNGVTTPNPVYPLPITQFSLGLAALFDTPLTTSSVTFTGPAGSGVTNVPADRRQPVTAGSFYESDTRPVSGTNLIGDWSVRYRGVDRPFTVTDPQTSTRFVAMLPTVTLNAAQTHVTAVSWVFKNRTTGATIPAPAEADAIQIEFTGFGIDYASPDLPRTVTSITLPTPLPIANLEFMYISFKDTATGHFYVTTYTQ